MIVLIDGYNLLHAVGWAHAKMAQKDLDPARRRLLDWLAASAPVKAGVRLHVVFDAQNGPFPSAPRSHAGIRVEFAYRATADDVIEELLDSTPKPREVVVVSNDLRLQDAAKRAKGKAWSHTEFLDFLEHFTARAAPADVQSAPEKPVGTSAEDEELLRVFAAGPR